MKVGFITLLILSLIVFSASGVIFARDPIQSVLLLVAVFILTACLFFIIGAEFLGVLLITVYVGAIAVLFLFVIMLLNLRMVEAYNSLYYHVPVGVFIGVFFLVITLYLFAKNYTIWDYLTLNNFYLSTLWVSYTDMKTNLSILGEVLYNYYIDLFIVIALILFTAMVGVIVITIDYDYRNNHYFPKKKIVNDRIIYDTTIWENVNVITKTEQYNLYYNKRFSVRKSFELELEEINPLPKWVRAFVIKYAGVDP